MKQKKNKKKKKKKKKKKREALKHFKKQIDNKMISPLCNSEFLDFKILVIKSVYGFENRKFNESILFVYFIFSILTEKSQTW